MTKHAIAAILSICACSFGLAQSSIRAIPLVSRSPEQKFPRVSGLKDKEAEARVNAILAKREQLDRSARIDCLHTHLPGSGSSYWESIRVVYLSPRLLSIRVSAFWDGCAAYPNYDIALPLTIDLVRGQELNWSNFFTDEFQRFQNDKPSPLMEVYLRHAALNPDCSGDVDRSDTSFNLWFDRNKSGLMVKPDLPHVEDACAELVTVPFSELQSWVRDPLDQRDLLKQ